MANIVRMKKVVTLNDPRIEYVGAQGHCILK